MQFLVSVQLPLLEYYRGRIVSSLDAFETLSFAFTQVMPGALGVSLGRKDESGVNADASRLTSGVEGVQRLCKALVSAKFITVAMGVWGEELVRILRFIFTKPVKVDRTQFFLELWAEINRQKSLHTIAKKNPSLPNPKPLGSNPPDTTIFDELIQQYDKLVSRSEDMIVQQVCKEIEGGLKSHFSTLTS